MEINDKAKVIVSPDALNEKFYSKRRYLHSITTEWPENPQERLLTIEQSESIGDDIFILAHIPQIHPMPEGNQHLFVENSDGSYVNDDFCQFYDFQRQVFLTSVVIVCVIVRRWKLLPITISKTAERISTIPTASLKVSDSSNTITPMATAVKGSKAPMMAVGVAPTS